LIEQSGLVNRDWSDALKKHLRMFIDPKGAHLTERTRPVGRWVEMRSELGTWPLTVGGEKVARWASRFMEANGLIANLVEYPAGAHGRARFRFQLMATRTPHLIKAAVERFCSSLEEANRMAFK